jgi:hypothetical protein
MLQKVAQVLSRHDLDGEVHPYDTCARTLRARGVKLEATSELSTCAICAGLSLQCSRKGERLPIISSALKLKESVERRLLVIL